MNTKREALVEKLSEMMKRIKKRKDRIKSDHRLQNKVIINPKISDDCRSF